MNVRLFSRLGRYGKSVATLVVSVGGALVTALTVGNVSLGDLDAKGWVAFAIAALGSAGTVHVIENIPGIAGNIARAVAAAATAGLGAIALSMLDTSVGGHVVTQAELIGAVVTAIVATGFVYQTDEGDRGAAGDA